MLVVSRKVDEKIHIGNDIHVTIVRVKGNTVRIGIEAPKSTRVLRSELVPRECAPMSNDILCIPLVDPNASHLASTWFENGLTNVATCCIQ